jgi:hypothetical protein
VIESKNLNKGGHKMNMHAKAWVKNAFNQWWKLWGYETKKLIANLSEDENFVMTLVDMLSNFVLQVAKKDGNMYPPTM